MIPTQILMWFMCKKSSACIYMWCQHSMQDSSYDCIVCLLVCWSICIHITVCRGGGIGAARIRRHRISMWVVRRWTSLSVTSDCGERGRGRACQHGWSVMGTAVISLYPLPLLGSLNTQLPPLVCFHPSLYYFWEDPWPQLAFLRLNCGCISYSL